MINLLHKKSENNMCKKDIANWKNEETCDIQDEQNEERNRDGYNDACRDFYEDIPDIDDLFIEAGKFVINKNNPSIGRLQREFKIGFNRAARIIDQLCMVGVVSEEEENNGCFSRKVLMSLEQFDGLITKSKLNIKIKERNILKLERKNLIDNSLKEIDAMNGIEFEDFCICFLRNLHFEKFSKTKISGDFGVDILCEKDGETFAVQCKRYKEGVGVSAIQEAYSGAKYYNVHKAIVLTNSFFTESARMLANKLNVVLYDRAFLKSNIKKEKSIEELEHDIDGLLDNINGLKDKLELINTSNEQFNKIANEIYNLFKDFNVEIQITNIKVDLEKTIYCLIPGKATRVKTILSYRDELCLRLGCSVKMNLESENGYIGVYIPTDYILKNSK